MINASRLSLNSDHLDFLGQHAYCLAKSFLAIGICRFGLIASNHEATSPLQSRSPSQVTKMACRGLSRPFPPPAGSLMLDKATPSESCCAKGTRQRHHFTGFRTIPIPDKSKPPEGLQCVCVWCVQCAEKPSSVKRAKASFIGKRSSLCQSFNTIEIIGRFCWK